MPSPAFVRLGSSSADLSRKLDAAEPGTYSQDVELTCAQVPQQFGPGSPLWLWLGSDNNKGVSTDWGQGIRALGSCKANDKVDGSREYRVVIDSLFLLPRSVSKMDLLEASPETYARALADASIVGLNNYSSQVVQILTDDEFATVTALIAEMTPEAHDELLKRVPNAAGVRIIRRSSFDESAVRELLETKLEPLLPRLEAQINDDDPVLQAVRRLVQDDKWGGVILQGVPGTGKSWYAREIAIKLVDGDARRMREIQFHPSYQYEDFIEGYVPRGSTGFELRDKHLLEMAAIARTTDGPVVLIIDEFSRTDPARVMGESLTYMEGSLREIEFRLPSGRKVSIPSNLILLATMNPEDRSVDEIDAAMDRRWAKVDLKPDAAKLRAFLELNGLQGEFIGPVLIFFSSVQEYIEIGHAFFRNVRDVSSLKRLWEHQLKHTVRKRFRFDPESLNAVLALWDECVHALTSIGNQSDDQ